MDGQPQTPGFMINPGTLTWSDMVRNKMHCLYFMVHRMLLREHCSEPLMRQSQQKSSANLVC